MHSGIDRQHVDASIRPQDDLYGHQNGGWLAQAVIPDDRPSDGVFYALRDAAEIDVRTIIEHAAAESQPGSLSAKVGDLYASFMDEAGVEARGREPISADLTAIRAVGDPAGVVTEMARLQAQGSIGGFLAPYVNTDARDATRYVVYLEQHGLGLPDESYYREERFAAIREAYATHVGRMLLLAGWAADGPGADAAAHRVMAVETRLAASHWNVVECRDAVRTYNRVPLEQVPGLAEGLSASDWLRAVGAPVQHAAEVVVRQPSYVASLLATLADEPVESWRDWLAWSLVRSSAHLLDSEMAQANFDFYGTTLSGVPTLRERWKRGVALVEGAMGEAVGELYVAEHFPPAAKGRMLELVENLVAAYRARLECLAWMGEATRERALAKLGAFTAKIGYPDRWRDYSTLEISPDDLMGNARRAAQHEARREWAKLGGPVDRLEWFMTPQTVNAYYNPGMNEIVFPAAILQPPFFDIQADDAVNYGAIGAVIGHEIGHGFDDQGSRYDGAGNLVDWWTQEDRARFDALAARLIAQFDGLVPRALAVAGEGAPSGEGGAGSEGAGGEGGSGARHAVNGALTVGENIGDLGGVAVAFEAYRLSRDGKPAPEIDGMTGEQRFFLGWAQAWRAKTRQAEEIRRLATDPHSPAEFRCNIVANLAEFHEAFGVRPGDGMWRDP
ncbi:MAG: M13-type metalloendopeptidase, partial [Candidatus Nanopelagicales bacterium]